VAPRSARLAAPGDGGLTEPDDPAVVTCRNCGAEVPGGRFCVRCGEPQATRGGDPVPPAASTVRRRMGAFAASPSERVLGPSLVSTLFPRLPRSQLGTFRIGLALGIGLVGGLTLAGLYPVALGVAAAIVPALIVVYVYAIDVYEDEPLAFLGLTMLWGVVAGGLFGSLSSGLATVTPGVPVTPGDALLRGVALPLIGAAIALVGPLLLVRRREFNDVLDGVTFGAAAGSAFLGAQTLAGAADLLSGGLRPVGSADTWLVQLLTVGVAQPIISAAVAAIVAGTIWLRIRAPERDRRALGRLGDPLVAIALGASLLVAAGLGRTLLGSVPALLWLVVVAILGLIWMRVLIHLGLMEEAAEIGIGPPIACPECGATTPYHTFCIDCGIALRALPRGRRPSPAAPPDAGGGRL
jgi:hypothetical protein